MPLKIIPEDAIKWQYVIGIFSDGGTMILYQALKWKKIIENLNLTFTFFLICQLMHIFVSLISIESVTFSYVTPPNVTFGNISCLVRQDHG